MNTEQPQVHLAAPQTEAVQVQGPSEAVRVVFRNVGDFNAMYAAEDWCAARGISVGHAERGEPRGLLYGDYDIQKWHNLSAQDRAELDGQMTGDMRNGPVTVSIRAGSAA